MKKMKMINISEGAMSNINITNVAVRNRYNIAVYNKLRILLFVLVALCSFMFLASSASAATITVDSTTGGATADGLCNLNEAITSAKTDVAVDSCAAGSGDDEIVFANPGVITYTGGWPFYIPTKITENVIITGHTGGTIIYQDNTANGFYIEPSANATSISINNIELDTLNSLSSGVIIWKTSVSVQAPSINLSNLHIHGFYTGLRHIVEVTASSAIVNLSDSIIEDNSQHGIFIDECAPPPDSMYVTNSIVQNNGGVGNDLYGGAYLDCGHLVIKESSFINNNGHNIRVLSTEGNLLEIYNSVLSGGEVGIHIDSNFTSGDTVSEFEIRNTTISGADLGIYYNSTGDLPSDIGIYNTVISGSTTANCYDDPLNTHNLTLLQNVSNVSSDTTCGFDTENTDPLLGSLTEMTTSPLLGPNQTLGRVFALPITSSSPLFNKGNNAECTSIDIQTTIRPSAYRCDIGAYEAPANKNIGKTLWVDTNKNGIKDTGEQGISGVTVDLEDASAQLLATTTTDSNGEFNFGVVNGTWTVRVTDTGNVLGAYTTTGNQVITLAVDDVSGNELDFNFPYILGATTNNPSDELANTGSKSYLMVLVGLMTIATVVGTSSRTRSWVYKHPKVRGRR